MTGQGQVMPRPMRGQAGRQSLELKGFSTAVAGIDVTRLRA
jgi:hypothetical protein